MEIDKWLQETLKVLKHTGIATARLDALVLLSDAIGKDKSYILAHSEEVLPEKILRKLDSQISRRIKHEPLAYIRGKSEFYGREFIVNNYTLEPRPETETMIALAIKVLGDRFEVLDKITVIDVGTGSGAIAVTMKLECLNLEVIATDIDKKCLDTATLNAKNLEADVTFCQGNLLEPLYNLEPRTSNLFAILANLPYVPNKYELNEAAKFEPKHAIFGGEDGLDLYRQLFSQLRSKEQGVRSKFVLTESLPFQHDKLARIAEEVGYKLEKTDDLIQLFTL